MMGIKEPIQPPLRGSLKADVLIIGAGAAGLAAALRFTGEGKRVVVLERNICGGSATGKSAGFLTPDSEMELAQLKRRFGSSSARALWNVPVKGIEIIKSAIGKYQIECDLLTQDSLFLGRGRAGWKAVQEEATTRKEFGFPSQLYSKDELPSILGSTEYSGAVRYPATHAMDALLYAQGVKHALLEQGVEVHESAEVMELRGHTAYTSLGSVTANQVIFCADKLQPKLSRYSWNVYYVQTFLAISEPLSAKELHSLFPEAPLQCWDDKVDYTYFRLTGDKRLLVGGETFWSSFAAKDTTTPNIIQGIIDDLKVKLPCIKNVEFIQYWPGRIDFTRDLLPTVVRDPDSPWIHYVLGCVGLPWATFCGDFVARQVLGDTTDQEYYHYFSADRRFLVPLWLERILGKRLVFTLNNVWSKYYQVDRKTSVNDQTTNRRISNPR